MPDVCFDKRGGVWGGTRSYLVYLRGAKTRPTKGLALEKRKTASKEMVLEKETSGIGNLRPILCGALLEVGRRRCFLIFAGFI